MSKFLRISRALSAAKQNNKTKNRESEETRSSPGSSAGVSHHYASFSRRVSSEFECTFFYFLKTFPNGRHRRFKKCLRVYMDGASRLTHRISRVVGKRCLCAGFVFSGQLESPVVLTAVSLNVTYFVVSSSSSGYLIVHFLINRLCCRWNENDYEVTLIPRFRRFD